MDSLFNKFNVKTHLLHELLNSEKATLEEHTGTHLVAIEVPPTTMSNMGRLVCDLARKAISCGAHVVLLTLPRSRKQSYGRLWCQR